MSKIPEAIKAQAWSLLLELKFHEGPSHKKLELIEKAIFAENERCAKIAEEWEGPDVLLPMCNDEQNEIARVGMTEASGFIASAIRGFH